MVNNIAANVLGGKPELEDGAEMEGMALISALRLAIKNALSWVCREKLLHLFAPLCLAAVCDWWGLSPCQQCWNCEAWQWKHVFDGFCSCACQNQTLPGCVCVCVCVPRESCYKMLFKHACGFPKCRSEVKKHSAALYHDHKPSKREKTVLRDIFTMSLERLQSSEWLKVYTKFVKGKHAMGCFFFNC